MSKKGPQKELPGLTESAKVRPSESKRWAPSRLLDARLRRYMRHVYKHVAVGCVLFLGAEEGNRLAAQLISDREGQISAVMLARLGVKTLGEQ